MLKKEGMYGESGSGWHLRRRRRQQDRQVKARNLIHVLYPTLPYPPSKSVHLPTSANPLFFIVKTSNNFQVRRGKKSGWYGRRQQRQWLHLFLVCQSSMCVLDVSFQSISIYLCPHRITLPFEVLKLNASVAKTLYSQLSILIEFQLKVFLIVSSFLT